ncbi:MAG: FAD-dependent oxidoreductase, partial [Candidatus Binatia bacterium]
RSLDVSGNRVTGVTCYNGETLEADLYVSALPHDILLTTLLPENLREDPFFARVAGLGWAPIVNVHLWYDRPIVDFDFAAFLNSPIQWVFNRSRILGLDEDGDGDGQHLCISLSGAWDYIDLSKEELFERFAREFRVLFPEAREANVKDYLVVKQRHATCSAEPGAQRQRLPQRTPLENFYLAGDWTLTGWPATMESAVRSGVFCAEAIEQNYRR